MRWVRWVQWVEGSEMSVVTWVESDVVSEESGIRSSVCVCVCVNHLNRCKTSTCRRCRLGFSVFLNVWNQEISFDQFHQQGNWALCDWPSSTKLGHRVGYLAWSARRTCKLTIYYFSDDGNRLSPEPAWRFHMILFSFWTSHSVGTEMWIGFSEPRCVYSGELISDPFGGHVLPPHEYWASAANSYPLLNSRCGRFLGVVSFSRPMQFIRIRKVVSVQVCVSRVCVKFI